MKVEKSFRQAWADAKPARERIRLNQLRWKRKAILIRLRREVFKWENKGKRAQWERVVEKLALSSKGV